MTPATAPVDRATYDYPGHFGNPARCRLRIYPGGPDRPVVVIATELEDNPGTSITNRAEALAAQVATEFGIDPDTMVWVEHYGVWRHLGESFSTVTFEPGTNWHATTKVAVERLIGRSLAD